MSGDDLTRAASHAEAALQRVSEARAALRAAMAEYDEARKVLLAAGGESATTLELKEVSDDAWKVSRELLRVATRAGRTTTGIRREAEAAA